MSADTVKSTSIATVDRGVHESIVARLKAEINSLDVELGRAYSQIKGKHVLSDVQLVTGFGVAFAVGIIVGLIL